jgi:hypothetical protein
MGIKERLLVGVENTYWGVTRRLSGTPGLVYENDSIEDAGFVPFAEFLDNADVRFIEEHDSWKLVMDLDGERRTTCAKPFRKDIDPKKPTFIFHHGAGMDEKFCRDLLKLYFQRELADTNTIYVMAQAHESNLTYKNKGADTLRHQQGIIAGSVLMTQELIERNVSQGGPVVVMGVSQGGMITAWHWLSYDEGEEKRRYFPIAAYPNVSEIFTSDGWKGLTDRQEIRKQMEAYKRAFESTVKDPRLNSNKERVYPVLGVNDPLIPYGQASAYWKGYDLKEYDLGHWLVGFAHRDIRRYIAKQTRELFLEKLFKGASV